LKNIVYAITLAGILSTVGTNVLAADEHHHHEKHGAQLMLNQGQKWQIDESLHTGMTRISQDVMANLGQIHHNGFSDKQFAELATRLEQHLSYLFENCKLEPKADAQLHTLLASVMQGIDKIKNAKNKKQGAVMIVQALKDYPVYFSDPSWQPIEH